jgi:VanZ family protein
MESKIIGNKIFRIICIIQLFIASGICIYCSSQEIIELPDITGFDKLAHLGAYFIYGLSLQVSLLAFFINSKKNRTNKNIAILVAVIGFLFAVSHEIHQYFVPGRNADWFDLLADFTGILLSLFLINTVKKIMLIIISR